MSGHRRVVTLKGKRVTLVADYGGRNRPGDWSMSQEHWNFEGG